MELERIALSDEYFIKRNLYPNVDFYSGIILKAIGIPTEMFTVIFALARTVGWISHWLEMHSGPYKIGRPRQLYTGYSSTRHQPLIRFALYLVKRVRLKKPPSGGFFIAFI